MEKRIPRRRFKEFLGSGDWEERKLGDVAYRFDNLRVPVTESNRVPGKTPYYGANGIVDYIDGFTHNGEFVLLAEDGANDLNNYPIHYVNGKVWVNNHAHVIQGIDNILENTFLVYSLKTIDISSYLVGGSRAKLNANTMMQLNISVPKNIAEQEKIGDFFQGLDRFIDINREKLEKLKASKSAYLSEIFPKEGEAYPRRRFKGFSGPWQERKLGDVSDVRDGTHDSPKFVLKGYPLITSKNVRYGYINYDEVKYISKEDYENINKRSKVDKNDILMGMIGTIGNIALIRKAPDFAIKNVALIKDINKINYLYLYYNIQCPYIELQLSEGMDGGTQKFIALNKIRNLNIPIPSLAEQEKIGNFFQKLDQEIGLQEEKLGKLEDLKKAYLAEMFV